MPNLVFDPIALHPGTFRCVNDVLAPLLPNIIEDRRDWCEPAIFRGKALYKFPEPLIEIAVLILETRREMRVHDAGTALSLQAILVCFRDDAKKRLDLRSLR